VGKLYRWGFPAYFDAPLVGSLVPGGGPPDGWRNFYYPTDPIGGPAARGLPETVQTQVDHEFLDPADCYFIYGQAPPASNGHSGYWADPRVWKRINALAASGNGIPAPMPVADLMPAMPPPSGGGGGGSRGSGGRDTGDEQPARGNV
jgi:hypothetical protein